MSIEQTLIEALRPFLREELEKALATCASAVALLDARGAAELLSLSEEAVRTLSKRRMIPRVVLPNGRVRFDRDELMAWAKGEPS